MALTSAAAVTLGVPCIWVMEAVVVATMSPNPVMTFYFQVALATVKLIDARPGFFTYRYLSSTNNKKNRIEDGDGLGRDL